MTATVREDLRVRYETYMRDRHIPDVLATGLFLGAEFSRTDDGRFRTRYLHADRESHERYLATHATRLRNDFASHFPEGITLDRDTWLVIKAWPH